MPHRTKHHAQVKMDIGVARVTALKGQDARESLLALQEHLANVDALECQQTSPSSDDDQPAMQLKTSE